MIVTVPARTDAKCDPEADWPRRRNPGSPNDDFGRKQQRFARLGYRLFARTVRQDQVALGARLGNDIHGPVPAAFSLSPYSARYLVEQRFPEVLPLKIVS